MRSKSAYRSDRPMFGKPFIQVLIQLASIKCLVGTSAFLFVAGIPDRPPHTQTFDILINVGIVLIFGFAGIFLFMAGREDQRAVALAGFFLTLGSIYSERSIHRLVSRFDGLSQTVLEVIHWAPLASFMPFLLWCFVRDFPKTSGAPLTDQVSSAGVSLASTVGTILLALNLLGLARVLGFEFWATAFLPYFEPRGDSTCFSYVMVGLVALALLAAIWKTKHAAARERRRVGLLIAGIVLGSGPAVVYILIGLVSPAIRRWQYSPENMPLISLIVFPPLLLIPSTTAYAVLVHRVLNVRLIARKALGYALARYSALALAAVPLVGLGVYLYRRRSESLEQIFTGSSAILLSLTAILGISLFVKRQDLIDAVDRKFFRDQYDARQILTPLVEHIRNTSDRAELSDLVCHGIDRALHLETIALLVEAPERGELVDPTKRQRPLMLSGPLVSLVAASREPLDVDLEKRPRELPHLSSEDRDWLIDGEFHLLVPIVSFDGGLLGIIAMGEKKSGLPILKEDRQLLAAIANSAALALEVQRLRREGAADPLSTDTPVPALPTASPAQECFGCGRLYLPHNQSCPTCERELEPALVPYVMPGRFRFERRLGAGGMGVVYRAVDLSLSRPVAIKTMRRVSVDDALRLRREARAAAAVVHPNLALIYLVESWQGNPMLIMEFLEKGTLSDRLLLEVLEPREALALGAAMASALEKLHSANILHRDLKPSNIGYSLDGTPKLMDFGIARLQFDLRREAAVLTDGPTAVPGMDSLGWAKMGTPATASRQLVGTLHYLSPEAVQGMPPDPTFDLWSLTAVLYECLTGDRIFRGSLAEVMAAIREAQVPPLGERLPHCPSELEGFFSRALHGDRSQRPASASELREQLEFLEKGLSGP